MAFNKSNYFEDKSVRISEFTKSLSHPARLEILLTLARQEVCLCGELVEQLPLAQSTVSQHLKELQKTGIINFEVEGTKSIYTINWFELETHFSAINQFADKLKHLGR